MAFKLINKILLAKLTAPDYGPATHGFSKHLDPPPEDKIEFYAKRWSYPGDPKLLSKRPTIPWDAFDKFSPQGKRICRIKRCGRYCPGGQWKTCGHKHSHLFGQEIRYYDWDYTRADVAERDGNKCVLCGITASCEVTYGQPGFRPYIEMQCDHIIPWAYVLVKFPDMPILEKIHRFYLNRENLRTLCPKCHAKVTARFLVYLPEVKRWVERRQNEPVITPLTEFMGH